MRYAVATGSAERNLVANLKDALASTKEITAATTPR